jgi:hypothetical protein
LILALLLFGTLEEGAGAFPADPPREEERLQAAGGPLIVAQRRRRKRRPRRRRPPPKPAPAPEPAAEPAPEPAAAPPPDDLRRGGRVEFDGRLVQGQTAKSGAIYLFARQRSNLRSMVRERVHYRKEILRSVNLRWDKKKSNKNQKEAQ